MRGYVLTGDQTPDEYVKEWEGDPWYPAIAEAHELLSTFIPGYQPTQIKSKFGGLRFYFIIDESAIDAHDPKRNLYIKLADAIVYAAEAKVQSIERELKFRANLHGKPTPTPTPEDADEEE